MSAFVVSNAHVDYLVQAGLDLQRKLDPSRPLHWLVPEPSLSTDSRRGEAWGPTGPEHAKARTRQLTDATANRVGEFLLVENERSIDHRYDARHNEARLAYHFERHAVYVGNVWRVEPNPAIAGDEGWRHSRTSLSPVNVLSALAAYEYQACEHDSWEVSEAHAYCHALRTLAINLLPGYADGPWAIQAPEDLAGSIEDTTAKPGRLVSGWAQTSAETRDFNGQVLNLVVPGGEWGVFEEKYPVRGLRASVRFRPSERGKCWGAAIGFRSVKSAKSWVEAHLQAGPHDSCTVGEKGEHGVAPIERAAA